MRSYYSLSRGKKIKQQHFSSITHDSNSTDKLEDEGALILTPPPPLQQCSVLKLHRKERSRNKDVISPRIELRTSRTEGRA